MSVKSTGPIEHTRETVKKYWNVMQNAFRWFGPEDRVSLEYIRQIGAESVFSSLHHIPYGDIWPLAAIQERKDMIESAGLQWLAVESLPIHEDIKAGTADREDRMRNYAESIVNLGQAGIRIVIYNFMPVLDWVRTDMRHKLDDGSESMLFNPLHFAAFDICILQRQGAENEYGPEMTLKAKQFFDSLTTNQIQQFQQNIIDVFPGTRLGLKIRDVQRMLNRYEGMDAAALKENLRYFLKAIIPVASEAGVKMAIHPDDPPWSILGLPRIVSCSQDIRDILEMCDDEANGICFCSGSFSARADNDLTRMIREFGGRIHAVHLRSTQRNRDGSFSEVNHLEGSVDMYEVVKTLLQEQHRRHRDERSDWQLAFRPDHGHRMMDDLDKPPDATPGYSAIGRMKGLAEIRGLQYALSRTLS